MIGKDILGKQGFSVSGSGKHFVNRDAVADRSKWVTSKIQVRHRVQNKRIVVVQIAQKIAQAFAFKLLDFRFAHTGHHFGNHGFGVQSTEIFGQHVTFSAGCNTGILNHFVNQLVFHIGIYNGLLYQIGQIHYFYIVLP